MAREEYAMKTYRQSKFLNPWVMFLTGLAIGVASRLFDIYFVNLGELFSQMAIWILIGTLISIYSPTRKAAMLNIFPFCIAMLITYYATAIITDGVYGWSFIFGWTVFALFSPLMAFLAWTAKCDGAFAKLIACGIVLSAPLSSLILFESVRFHDFVITAVLLYFLFFKNIDSYRRNSNEKYS